MQKVLVSACLLGQPVRYDGNSLRSSSNILEQWDREGRIVFARSWRPGCRFRVHLRRFKLATAWMF